MGFLSVLLHDFEERAKRKKERSGITHFDRLHQTNLFVFEFKRVDIDCSVGRRRRRHDWRRRKNWTSGQKKLGTRTPRRCVILLQNGMKDLRWRIIKKGCFELMKELERVDSWEQKAENRCVCELLKAHWRKIKGKKDSCRWKEERNVRKKKEKERRFIFSDEQRQFSQYLSQNQTLIYISKPHSV